MNDILAPTWGPYPWKHPTVPDVRIDLKVPFERVSHVDTARDGQSLPFELNSGRMRFTVPNVDTHTIVAVAEA